MLDLLVVEAMWVGTGFSLLRPFRQHKGGKRGNDEEQQQADSLPLFSPGEAKTAKPLFAAAKPLHLPVGTSLIGQAILTPSGAPARSEP